MERAVKVACVQAEPVVLDRERTLAKLAELTAEAAGAGAELVVFPETFVPVYLVALGARVRGLGRSAREGGVRAARARVGRRARPGRRPPR